MKRIKNMLKKNKILSVLVVGFLLFALIIGVPTLAKLRNRTTIYNASSWDGSVASNYKKGDGTEDNPYIISSGSELAYFFDQLKTTDYENKYFELSNDIIINPGVFEYDDEKIKYILNDEIYYVNKFTNQYYDNQNFEGDPVGGLNQIGQAKTFKGNFNGKSYTIYGSYLFNEANENVSLFENLNGNIENIYFSNSMIYGKENVAGLAINTNDSTISNLSLDGYIINKSDSKIKTETLAPFASNVTILGTEIKIELPQINLEGLVKSITLFGDYEISNVVPEENVEISLSINGNLLEKNKFEIDLGTTQLSEIYLLATSTVDNKTINFSNLKYVVEYYDDITSGLFVNSFNTSLNNIINKSFVSGNYLSAGMIANAEDTLQISRSYNNGQINSLSISGGIIGQIKNNTNHVTLTNVYNTGNVGLNLSGGLIGLIQDNTGLIKITNSINTSANYAINTIVNSTVNAVDCYSVNGLSVYNGIMTGEFTLESIENFYNKDFMTQIKYLEFVNFDDLKTNGENVWIYEKNSMPILYIDNLNNPIATINLNKYSWNNLGLELNSISVEKNITFMINQISATNPIKEKYYFVSSELTSLTVEQLNLVQDWKLYEEPVKIDKSGYYVIYAKIVDKSNQISYINTDIIALNTTGFQAVMNVNDMSSDTLKLEPNDIYINKNINVSIVSTDALFGINSVEYYISEEKLTEDQIKNITEWNIYTESLTIYDPGKYIIYAKITNGEGKTKYISSDYLLYNGYYEIMNLGNKNIDYGTNYITNNSTINMSFEGDFELKFMEGYSHNIIFNMLLPQGTKLTLIDKLNNKVYEYKIESNEDLFGYNTSCIGVSNCSKYATYKFSDFKEIGKTTSLNYNEESNYNKTIKKEKFVLSVDFSNANIVENYYDIFAYMAIKDNQNSFLYKTFEDLISKFNIYSSLNGEEITVNYSMISDYNDFLIYYNSNSESIINFVNVLEYGTVNEKSIIDTTYENKKAGLIIGLYNQNDELLNKQYLNNMLFEVNNKEYFAASDNKIKINLGSATDISKVLKIKTKENSSGLSNGEYYLKINKFISDDGYYYDSLFEDEIIIPILVEEKYEFNYNYNFDVGIDNESILINKKQEEHLTMFNMSYYGDLQEPNIRISLYEKKEMTAYNQEYTLVDLSKYTNDILISVGSNQYFVDIQNVKFNLNILPAKFNNNGYKFVFELYDGTKKVSELEKYFIVN